MNTKAYFGFIDVFIVHVQSKRIHDQQCIKILSNECITIFIGFSFDSYISYNTSIFFLYKLNTNFKHDII